MLCMSVCTADVIIGHTFNFKNSTRPGLQIALWPRVTLTLWPSDPQRSRPCPMCVISRKPFNRRHLPRTGAPSIISNLAIVSLSLYELEPEINDRYKQLQRFTRVCQVWHSQLLQLIFNELCRVWHSQLLQSIFNKLIQYNNLQHTHTHTHTHTVTQCRSRHISYSLQC